MKRIFLVVSLILGLGICLCGCQNGNVEEPSTSTVEEQSSEVGESTENEEERTLKTDALVDEMVVITKDFLSGNSSGDIRSLNDWVNTLRPYYDDNLFAKEVVDRFEEDDISNMTDIEKDFISAYIQTLLRADVDYSNMRVYYAYAAGYSEDGSVSSELEYNYRGLFLFSKDTIVRDKYDYSNIFVNVYSFEDTSMNPEGIERHTIQCFKSLDMANSFGISPNTVEGEISGTGNENIVGLHYYTIDCSQFNEILRSSSLIEFAKEFKIDGLASVQEKTIKKDDTSSTNNEDKEPAIGMTEEEVLNSSWGAPEKKNINTYEWGIQEQWVYSKGYIYFENGAVTKISYR